MAGREKRISVYEPSRHGRKWRIEIRDGVTGERIRPSFGSEADAWKAFTDALKEVALYQEPTLGELIDPAYRDHLRDEKGNRRSSITTTMNRLNAMLCQPELPITRFTAKRAQAMYESRKQNVKVDTHRNELSEVKTFCKWLVKKKHIRVSPAKEIEGTGKRTKGKKQHRPTEAKQFQDYGLKQSLAGNDGSFAAVAALLLGLRQNAITLRDVRDVDVLTHQLYIEGDKTEAGERSVEIPDILWPHFEMRIQDRDPNEPLLPARSKNGYRCSGWVRNNALRICEALGIPKVNAQGLRGTHSTLAEEGGATGHLVAKQLGHADEKTTREYYTAPGTVERKQRKRVLKVLAGGK